MRKYWKTGCNWRGSNTSYYDDLMKKHSIVVCCDSHDMKDLDIGDVVAIAHGFDIFALAEVTGEKHPVTEFAELRSDFGEAGIEYEDSVYVANCQIIELDDSEHIEYRAQRGILQIQDMNVKKKIDHYIEEKFKPMNSKKNLNEYVQLLKSNHNLILTGAPGTGKTYIAKEIAKGMGCTDDEIGFVQFHPSYDYTDFVEGIRPNDNNGFERRDGVFIKFCNKALMNIENSKKRPDVLSMENSVKKKYEYLLSKIDAGEIQEVTLRTNKKMLVDKISNNKNIILRANQTTTTTHTVSLNRILKLSEKFHDKNSLDNISNINTEITDVIGGCNASAYWAVLHLVYEQELEILSNSTSEREKNYVFIIDEINRGEISKIFGELFYSIDPGYRGKDGKVKTQYASMQHEPNDFDVALGIKERDECGWFFVPENVYIIGTMNDIDRSVESMDFAFRRRFAFAEIKADENVGMLDGLKWKNEAIKRMNSLNKMIWHEEKENEKKEDKCIEGLSSAYHIGASYFLKLKNYNGDFDQLWKYHLDGLLREYLRGMPDTEAKMVKLKKAYDSNNTTTNGSDSNNG